MTLVYVWCSSLWECFHCAEGETLSHSHVVEWIFGSRIQSHWPCMMLCPISMLSRILATLSPIVPTIHAGGNIDTSSTARLPSSSLRRTSMTLRMYAASLSPRLSSISSRIASSSLPRVSMSSSLRWAMGLWAFFCSTVMVGSFSCQSELKSEVRSELDVARAGGRVDAGLDRDAVAL